MKTDQSAFKYVDYSDDDKAHFYQTLRQAATSFGCNYISYVYENPSEGVRVGFSSNPDWQKEYIANKMIDHCHLWNTVLRYFVQTDREAFILPWDTVKPNDKFQKEIILYRDEMEVGRNGISFCTQSKGKREYLAFAPGRAEPNFSHHLVNNMETVRDIARVFRSASNRAVSSEEKHAECNSGH